MTESSGGTGPQHGRIEGHGGELALAALRAFGVSEMFTLSGGHVFPLYDAAHTTGCRSTTCATSSRRSSRPRRSRSSSAGPAWPCSPPGPASPTASPASPAPSSTPRRCSCSAGGRRSSAGAPAACRRSTTCRWCAPVTKHAATVDRHRRHRRRAARRALTAALTPAPRAGLPGPAAGGHLRPRRGRAPGRPTVAGHRARPGRRGQGGRADRRGRSARSSSPAPTCTPATPSRRCARPPRRCRCRSSPTAWAGAACRRSTRSPSPRPGGPRSSGADVVAVIGTPLDFRLSFGDFGEAQVVHIVDAPSQRATHVTPAVSPAGDLRLILSALADYAGTGPTTATGSTQLRQVEDAAEAKDAAEMEADTDPIKPAGSTASCARSSTPTRSPSATAATSSPTPASYLEPAQPGTWLDPGPYGCLGTGMGYAMGARVTYPDRQICVLHGRRRRRLLADGRRVAGPPEAAGGHRGRQQRHLGPGEAPDAGACTATTWPPTCSRACATTRSSRPWAAPARLVEKAADLGPALRRAFDAGVPYLVNVLTDPDRRLPPLLEPGLTPGCRRPVQRDVAPDHRRSWQNRRSLPGRVDDSSRGRGDGTSGLRDQGGGAGQALRRHDRAGRG